MPTLPPKRLDRGLRYINTAFNSLIDYVERIKVIPTVGWEETPNGIMPPVSGGGGGENNPLKVLIHSDGKLTQNVGTMADTTVGSTFNGIPTVLSADGVAYSATNVVTAKVEYEAVDNTEAASAWMTTAITFEVYAEDSIPADTLPAYTTTWTDGVYYMTWATTDEDGIVDATETGPCRMVYCSSADVRVVT